jgi:hypothetical protein
VTSVPAGAVKSKRRPAIGEPSAFRAMTEMVDIELPSLDRTCGAAVTLSDWANPDGPASAGASWLSTAHAEAKTATATIAAPRRRVAKSLLRSMIIP